MGLDTFLIVFAIIALIFFGIYKFLDYGFSNMFPPEAFYEMNQTFRCTSEGYWYCQYDDIKKYLDKDLFYVKIGDGVMVGEVVEEETTPDDPMEKPQKVWEFNFIRAYFPDKSAVMIFYCHQWLEACKDVGRENGTSLPFFSFTDLDQIMAEL